MTTREDKTSWTSDGLPRFADELDDILQNFGSFVNSRVTGLNDWLFDAAKGIADLRRAAGASRRTRARDETP